MRRLLLIALCLATTPIRSVSGQVCVANNVGCDSGNSTWWSTCGSATIGGGSLALSATNSLSIAGTPVNNVLIATKLVSSGSPGTLLQWTQVYQSGPSPPTITSTSGAFANFRFPNVGKYYVALWLGAWSVTADPGLGFYIAYGSNYYCYYHNPQPAASPSTQNQNAGVNCVIPITAANAEVTVYSTSSAGGICNEAGYDSTCGIYIQQIA